MTSKCNPGPSRKRWESLNDSQLLRLRFCDLGLSLKHSAAPPEITDLYATLERRGIRFRPHAWLSTEWFSPDGTPGIAVPFYLAHPRLTRLERHFRGEAEGGNRQCRQAILRHEAGHAIDTAFALRRRAGWRAVFGRASRPYPGSYTARPASRRFVQHLRQWYGQSHPTEDFAETFAVWLQPKARWRRDYAGWPALRKLEYVDSLMAEIAGKRAICTDRSTPASLRQNTRSLGEHYRRNRSEADRTERRYDSWLLLGFARRQQRPDAASAGVLLRRLREDIRRSLSRRGASHYLIDHVQRLLWRRSHALDLVVAGTRREASRRAIDLHGLVLDDILRRNREHFAL